MIHAAMTFLDLAALVKFGLGSSRSLNAMLRHQAIEGHPRDLQVARGLAHIPVIVHQEPLKGRLLGDSDNLVA